MVFNEIVTETCERLNLTSDEAKSRVAREINNRYRRATSSIGLATSRFTQVAATASIGNRNITFNGIEKVLAVIDKSSGVDVPLTQISIDELHINPIKTEPPRKYAILQVHANSVVIYVDGPPETEYVLYADGIEDISTLTGNQSPDFPESFHDILVFGAMADEYRKMEKMELAQMCEQDYEKRLSDLRMFIAKTAYMDVYQGRYAGKTFRWTRDAQTYWNQ